VIAMVIAAMVGIVGGGAIGWQVAARQTRHVKIGRIDVPCRDPDRFVNGLYEAAARARARRRPRGREVNEGRPGSERWVQAGLVYDAYRAHRIAAEGVTEADLPPWILLDEVRQARFVAIARHFYG
jgi:hypothetical protein